jgi:hypothetical protein
MTDGCFPAPEILVPLTREESFLGPVEKQSREGRWCHDFAPGEKGVAIRQGSLLRPVSAQSWRGRIPEKGQYREENGKCRRDVWGCVKVLTQARLGQ